MCLALIAALVVAAHPPPSPSPTSPPATPGTCLLGAYVDTPTALQSIESLLGKGAASRGGGYARCFYVPEQELFIAVGVSLSLPSPHKLQFLYLGRYPWPDCSLSQPRHVERGMLTTAEGLEVGDSEDRLLALYGQFDGLQVLNDGNPSRRFVFHSLGRHLVTEIGVTGGQVVTIQVSHAE